MNRQELGSKTAKGGFENEFDVCDKFSNFQNDKDAQSWLKIMGYQYDKIQKISVSQIPVRINLDKAISLGVSHAKYNETIKFKKADIQVRVEIVLDDILYVENISLKKSNKSAGFNQIDKRPVDTYQKIWNFDDSIAKWLKLFTGDILPKKVLTKSKLNNIKDQRRLFFTEIPSEALDTIIKFFRDNKILIISDIIRGRGGLSADWILVTRKYDDGTMDWIIKDINYVCNFYGQGDILLTPRGSLKIGRVSMQRKGGTPDPTSLQFKMNPLDLFGADDGK